MKCARAHIISLLLIVAAIIIAANAQRRRLNGRTMKARIFDELASAAIGDRRVGERNERLERLRRQSAVCMCKNGEHTIENDRQQRQKLRRRHAVERPRHNFVQRAASAGQSGGGDGGRRRPKEALKRAARCIKC